MPWQTQEPNCSGVNATLLPCPDFAFLFDRLAAPAYDTAGAVKIVIDVGAAAIVSVRCAQLYGGKILAAAIESHPYN